MVRMRFLFILLIMICSYFDVLVLALGRHNRELKQIKVGFVSSVNDCWGKMALDFTKMAISDFYKQHPDYKTRLLLQARDSQRNDVVASAKAVEELIEKEHVVAIIGPETSQEAHFDISLGEKYKVPIISYSASSPMLSSPYFIQATQDDSSQVQAISSIIQAFGWREVTPIYVNNEFGLGIIPFLVDALQQINTRIPYRSVISSSATDDQIKDELFTLREKQTRVFVVHMNETLASRLFSAANEVGMMTSEYVWIITSNIANALGTLDHGAIRSMGGVLGLKTYVDPHSKVVGRFNRNKSFNLDSSNLQKNIYGLWAYDAAFLLAEAVEKIHESNFTFRKVSGVGPKLIRQLINIRFQGLSGNFSLHNRRLRTSTFEIINVIGNGEHTIGFWTHINGLLQKLDSSNTRIEYSTSKDNLLPILWPGGHSTETPKGWVIPKHERHLKIGVPAKIGFTEFVKATINETNEPTGFCIDVFESVKKTLPYDLPVKYIPDDCSYDDLISKVHNRVYDAVVGDVTIIFNRSLYVDFTLPYMESDILMVVPAVLDSKANRAWAFMRPLSWKLWTTSFFFFILIAFVIWVNEYQINDEFRAESWKAQIGQCLFYSFSTMVFSHKEAPKSNLSRFVMIFWVFTLLLLTQSYTASLSAMLTTEKLKPAYQDVNDLKKTGKRVAYQNGTFVKDYLLNKMRFEETKIVSYNTAEELDQLFTKGSENGGIDAAFDGAPYMKLFLASYCSKYMKVRPPTSNTDGFAFVFPIGSPLVSDISRGVLNVTEGDIMTAISKKWLNGSESCPIYQSSIPGSSSGTLELDSFVVLFAITGGACVATVVYKLAFFLYENRRVLQRNGGMTFNERLQELNKSFHAKRGSIVRHKFESRESSRGSSPLHMNSVVAVELEVIDDVEVVTVPPSPSPSSSP